jgi:hypothetical protein
MSTAQGELLAKSPADPYLQYMTSPIQDRVPRIVNILLAYRGLSARQLASKIGLSPQKFSDRMNGRSRFTLEEAEQMAAVLGVGPGVWFDEPEAVMAYLSGGASPEANNRWTSPDVVTLGDDLSSICVTSGIAQMGDSTPGHPVGLS